MLMIQSYAHEKLTKNSRIACYLRKSREENDSDDTLSKHRMQLSEYVDTHEFKNVQWFEEVVSADSISKRPVFIELLSMIEDNEFDAVLVVHYDRLTRGSQIDNGLITKTFKDSDTLILTPSRVYDLSDESAELMSEVEGLLSRAEYRSIKRRMKQGKVNATKQGKHATGIVPFPYKRDKNTDMIYIDDEERKIAEFIISSYLSGWSTNQIAVKLNERKVPTVRGSVWRNNQILRLLTSDFHRGYVVIGKSYRDPNGKKQRQTDESKIVRVRGNHPVLIDETTARRIDRLIANKRPIPMRARQRAYVLSGIMRCGFCGSSIGFTTDRKREPHKIYLRKCLARRSDGIQKCNKNMGISESKLLEQVYADMVKYRETLFDQKSVKPKINVGRSPIEMNREIVEKATDKLERLKSLYVDGIINREEFNVRKTAVDLELMDAKAELEKLVPNEKVVNAEIVAERKEAWSSLDIENLFFGNSTAAEKNRAMQKLIDHIDFKRIDDTVHLNIVYK